LQPLEPLLLPLERRGPLLLVVQHHRLVLH
jgi:hypothetical protein